MEIHYPGGLDAYCAEAPGLYLEDEHLTRVAFLASEHADEFFDRLLDLGLYQLAISGEPAPEWLETDGRHAWLAGTEPGELVRFEGLLVKGLQHSGEEVHVRLRALCDSCEAVEQELGGRRARYILGNAQVDVETLEAPVGTGVIAVLDRARRAHLKEDFALVRAFREALTGAR